MANYELVFKKSVANDLRSIPKRDVARILKRIEALRDDPRGEGCTKLSAQERYRVRQGVYRIVYETRITSSSSWSSKSAIGLQSTTAANKAVKPFVAVLLTRTLSTPRLLGHGFAIFGGAIAPC